MTGSDTAAVNIINLQVMAEDQIETDKQIILDSATGQTLYDANVASNSKYYIWKGPHQTIPMGMDGEPEQYAARLAEALPLVTTLRIPFNEFSFNSDGSLHDQFERFLAAAASEGFTFIPVYASGDIQQIGEANAPGYDPLPNSEAYSALEDNFSDVSDAWNMMLDWLEENQPILAAVHGFELMNEPAGYRHSIRANGSSEGLNLDDFVQLYADHVIALAHQIHARMSGEILVGAWGYSGDIATLDETMLGGHTAIEYITAGMGTTPTWSVHLFPGWSGTNAATSSAELEVIFDDHFAPLHGYNVIVTETNIHGTVDDITNGWSSVDFFAQSFEWFAENGIGLGWFPGAETGGSHLVTIDGNGSLRYLHQHSLAHALNAYSLGGPTEVLTGSGIVNSDLTAARLRNESYESDYNPLNRFDAVQYLGTGFGGDGDDMLIGSDNANDMLYGGAGNDQLSGGLGDDFLFGQYGDDLLQASSGINHMYGGDGADTLLGGSGYDQFSGGRGSDTFQTGSMGNDVIVDFEIGLDLILLEELYSDFSEIVSNMIASDADADGFADDSVLTFQTGATLTFIDVLPTELSADDFIIIRQPIVIEGTSGSDFIDLGASDSVWSESHENWGSGAVVNAHLGNDRIIGADGDDTIFGGAGRDRIDGGLGNDELFGNEGDDKIKGGRGDDTIFGGIGDDSIYGNKGYNHLDGGEGNDHLSSGDHASTLFGGDGDDSLYLRAKKGGNHIATGGEGSDTFHFLHMSKSVQSHMIITDYTLGLDHFTIDSIMADDYFAQASCTLSGNETETILTTSQMDTITFEGIRLSDFVTEFII